MGIRLRTDWKTIPHTTLEALQNIFKQLNIYITVYIQSRLGFEKKTLWHMKHCEDSKAAKGPLKHAAKVVLMNTSLGLQADSKQQS